MVMSAVIRQADTNKINQFCQGGMTAFGQKRKFSNSPISYKDHRFLAFLATSGGFRPKAVTQDPMFKLGGAVR